MTPNLIINLDIDPITLMWNGQAISLPGTYELVPDNEIKHLHKAGCGGGPARTAPGAPLRQGRRKGPLRQAQRVAHRGRQRKFSQGAEADGNLTITSLGQPRRPGGVRSTARKQRSPMKMRERLCRWLVRVLMPGYYIARIGKRGKRIAESNGNLEGLC